MRKRQPRFFRKAFGNPVVLLQPRRWCVSDPLPPSAALPLVRGRRERSERGGRSHTISNWANLRPGNPLAGEHGPAWEKPLVPAPLVPVVIEELEISRAELEQCDIRRCAYIQRAAVAENLKSARGVDSCACDRHRRRHTEAQ